MLIYIIRGIKVAVIFSVGGTYLYAAKANVANHHVICICVIRIFAAGTVFLSNLADSEEAAISHYDVIFHAAAGVVKGCHIHPITRCRFASPFFQQELKHLVELRRIAVHRLSEVCAGSGVVLHLFGLQMPFSAVIVLTQRAAGDQPALGGVIDRYVHILFGCKEHTLCAIQLDRCGAGTVIHHVLGSIDFVLLYTIHFHLELLDRDAGGTVEVEHHHLAGIRIENEPVFLRDLTRVGVTVDVDGRVLGEHGQVNIHAIGSKDRRIGIFRAIGQQFGRHGFAVMQDRIDDSGFKRACIGGNRHIELSVVVSARRIRHILLITRINEHQGHTVILVDVQIHPIIFDIGCHNDARSALSIPCCGQVGVNLAAGAIVVVDGDVALDMAGVVEGIHRDAEINPRSRYIPIGKMIEIYLGQGDVIGDGGDIIGCGSRRFFVLLELRLFITDLIIIITDLHRAALGHYCSIVIQPQRESLVAGDVIMVLGYPMIYAVSFIIHHIRDDLFAVNRINVDIGFRSIHQSMRIVF